MSGSKKDEVGGKEGKDSQSIFDCIYVGPLRSCPKEARVECNADLGQVSL